jgi:Tol biopolymer transport system component
MDPHAGGTNPPGLSDGGIDDSVTANVAAAARLRAMSRSFPLAAAFAAAAAFAIHAQPGPRPVRVTLHEGTSLAAALSPDGRTIAIDLLGTLWTMPAAGGTATPITDIAMDARQPSWSRDGTRIAFQAYRSSTWQIWTVKADGTDLRPVTSGPYDDREPAWSPDGRQIAFSSDRGGSYDVWLVTLATGGVAQVTSAASNEFQPSWRGGSAEIAYVSDRRERPGVYASAAGGGERLAAASSGSVAGPAFAPDGSSIAFSVVAGSRSRLMIGDLATGAGQGRNIADPDEDVFPFRPQWVSPSELLYTADGA